MGRLVSAGVRFMVRTRVAPSPEEVFPVFGEAAFVETVASQTGTDDAFAAGAAVV